MKVLQINTVYAVGSTGNIAKAIHDLCKNHQIQCLTAHRCTQRGELPYEDTVAVSSKWDSRIHGLLSRFSMFKGVGSLVKTTLFLRQVSAFAPDVIHLHNLHGSYINLPLLFRYIKKHRIPVVWTLHDCWPFTAICSHFVAAKCDKWKTGCGNCPQKKRFSSSPLDFTGAVWRAKKAWFTGLPCVTLVTPSNWLNTLVRASYLCDYPVKTIYNGIDLSVFRETASDFRTAHGLEGKHIVLGVAFDWGYSKGLDVFVELSKRLPSTYKIVLVGTNDEIDRRIPDNILSIHRTADQVALAQIYSAADVFVNPTREEVFGLVNVESLACGTPVITFETGGCPECVDDTCGIVIADENVDILEQQIHRVCQKKPFSKEDCRKRALLFEKDTLLMKYLDLYESVAGSARTQQGGLL